MTEWRKHDLHFLQNAKVMEAAMRGGPMAPLLALMVLDLNAVGDRRGTLNELESRPRTLARRLIGSGLDATEAEVTELLAILEDVGFLTVDEAGRIGLPGWSDDEFGIRGRAPKPKGMRGCDRCGKAFKPTKKDNRFCSDSCRKRDHENRRNGSPDDRTDGPDDWPDGRLDDSDGEREGETESSPSRLEVTNRPPLQTIHSESAAAAVELSLMGLERQTASYASTSQPIPAGDILQGIFRRGAV